MLISGNTYPVKDKLKAMGGVWRPLQLSWEVPDAVGEKAKALVAAAGPKASPGRRPTRYSRDRSQGYCAACRASASGMCRQCSFDEYDC